MSDDRFEEHVRTSLRRVELPEAPERLIQRAEGLRTSVPTRPSRLSLILVLATMTVVAAYGSLIVASRVTPMSEHSPSPSASEATGATPTPLKSQTPTPAPRSSATATSFPIIDWPYPTAPGVEPAQADDLPLAGRAGVPGYLDCGLGPGFSVDAVDNPTGAEDLPGPEYDALREVIQFYVGLGAPELGPSPTAREVAHHATSAMFLVEHAGSGPGGGFPFVPIAVGLVDGRWVGDYGVDCQPRAVLPPGYERATWTLDPAHSAPTARTRALHILVQEHDCSSGRTPSGRIGPAYVVVSRSELAIEVIVKRLPGGQDCPGNPPTRARLSLPEAIGDRFLWDVNETWFSGTGG